MARYTHDDYSQMKMLPISFDRQILPGTFAYTRNYLIDEQVDLGGFNDRDKNDETGAPAYDPALLLKIVLFAYSKGILHSRKIEPLCRENVVCLALSADAVPPFTTSADFISSLAPEITTIFRNGLLVCDEAGLIGKEMFAVDGVTLPSKASKEWSGTKAELKKKGQKRQRAVEHLLSKHQANDRGDFDESMHTAADRQLKTLNRAIEKVETFLATHEETLGRSGKPIQSHITDNEAAQMPTAKGVVQGYTGAASADEQPQVIVHAEAFGEGQEPGVLVPRLEGTRASFEQRKLARNILKEVKLTADAGDSSEAKAASLFDSGVEAYVADTKFRTRDPRFEDAARHKPTRPDEPFAKPKRDLKCQTKDFPLAADHSHAICPAGKRLYRRGTHKDRGGRQTVQLRAPLGACRHCPLRAQCLRNPERTRVRQVAFVLGRVAGQPEKYLTKMPRKIDSEVGRYEYSRRLGIIEPVFGNIRNTKRLTRFTRRGRRKVNAQWQLYCLVHNIETIQRHGRLDARTMSGRRRAA
jgi:transposase